MNLILMKVKKHNGDIINKMIPIKYNLRKFIKILINIKVIAEWSILKTNKHEIPIA
ncbi:hypothetical protein RhiirA4_457949 [Rhizophagus irregularis]|uniref:Uncharacterized protein n=1 Tax=Rhizophagus irregularis TaxID=588596 RepID=A0A2I1GB66_9GLOM|nr:hypothetical protein RhiirA4_457949 [Rhizophagus irregularis]